MAQKKKRRKQKKKSGGFGTFLLKTILFVAVAAAVFWLVTKGLDRLDSGKNGTVTPGASTVTPGGKNPGGDPATPGEGTKAPTKKPEKTPTEAPKKPTATPTPEATETPTPTEAPKDLTTAQAVEKLKSLSAAKLKLPSDPSKYTYEPDDWTSNIEGKECICVNVLGADGLRVAVYYVAVDGSRIFREAEDNVFETVAP